MNKRVPSLCCFAMLIWSVPAFAVPVLQLDIGGGWYNRIGDPFYDSRYDNETIVSKGDSFILYALMKLQPGKTSLSEDYTIAMALYPPVPELTPRPNYGSFIFDGNTYGVTADMAYGTPAYDKKGTLPTHDVYPTYYKTVTFNFVAGNTVGEYDTQLHPGEFKQFLGGSGLYYAAFVVDTSGLSDEVSIHFDLYDKRAFAPFSHDGDAQSDPPPPVPEPASLLLLCLGLAGLAGVKRRLS
jgi:hypothetical protein